MRRRKIGKKWMRMREERLMEVSVGTRLQGVVRKVGKYSQDENRKRWQRVCKRLYRGVCNGRVCGECVKYEVRALGSISSLRASTSKHLVVAAARHPAS
jgi:hypothetical protein